jgi:sentrin-specific protease 2 (axin associating molecule)
VLEEGSESDVMSSAFNLKISRGDMQCLRDGEWLGDEVNKIIFQVEIFPKAVNFYLNVVMDHAKQSGRKFHVFNTFFLGLLGDSYDKVKRWTRKVKELGNFVEISLD